MDIKEGVRPSVCTLKLKSNYDVSRCCRTRRKPSLQQKDGGRRGGGAAQATA